MDQDKQALRIRYEYEQDPNAKLQYAHGVWGGINTHGEIELNFYTESDKMPSYTECILANDGTFGHEMPLQEENVKDVTRHIHAKVLLNYHTARSVLEWLEDKIQTLEEEEQSTGMFLSDSEGCAQ